MKDKDIYISVVIPVKNGAMTLQSCLTAILKQSLATWTEVIVIDSGSTDKSLEIINSYPVKLYQIKPEEFNHGETRNYGASLANGKFVVMTVQDAIPANDKWLENMIRHFDDSDVMAVCGKQIVPHEKEKNPAQWFRPCSKVEVKKIQFKNKYDFLALSSLEQRIMCSLEDVTAAYRKEYLILKPLKKTLFAEDMICAKEIILSGHAIIYDPTATVYHYHHENLKTLFKRLVIEAYSDHEIFSIQPKFRVEIIKFIRSLNLVLISALPSKEMFYWIWYNTKCYLASFICYNLMALFFSLTGVKSLKFIFKKVVREFPIGKIK